MSAKNQPARSGNVYPVWRWLIASCLLVVCIACALRLGTDILAKDVIYDERYIRVPIVDLIEQGWSVDTAINFEETKGPGMIWPYAAINRVLGAELNALRLTSMLMFIGGAVPLLALALRAGINDWKLLIVAIGYVLLPYHAVLGQLLMSEASFVFGALCLFLIFQRGMNLCDSDYRRATGWIVLFAIVLSVLLHHRIHAAAFAAAACLTALNRDGMKCWPWWLACAIAVSSRVPLWMHWGGLVSPAYQGPHGLGVSIQNLSYLSVTLVSYIGVFLVASVILRPRWWWLALVGAGCGMLLGGLATPNLADTLPIFDTEVLRYQGIAATFVGRVAGDGWYASILLMVLAAIGVGGLGGLAAFALDKAATTTTGVLWRVQFWSLAAGWGMYLFTNSVVYDRYPLAWAVILPILWLRDLPVWLLALQLVGLALVFASLTHTWLL